MKLHKTKDIIAVISATVGILCISFDKCYTDMKQMYYIFFLSTIVVIDSIFVVYKNAYEVDFGKNVLTFIIAFIYFLIYIMIFNYIISCRL